MDRAGLYRTGLGVVALAVLAGGRTAPTEAANGAKFICAADIRTLDPALIASVADERGVLACFEGLTVLDPASGQAKPGAAESWETSADGRTWTFKLRDATWRKGPDASFAEAKKVKASDFVYAWLRLMDRETGSPHSHVLDVLPGVSVLSTDRPRSSALDDIATDLEAAVGPGKKTLTSEQVQEFLNNSERNPRRWLREVEGPEAKEFLEWKEKPYQALKAAKLIAALRAEVKRLLAGVDEAQAHVGKDRAFWAKDDKTLVVQTAGASPWLPSLLARGPLVPVHSGTVDRNRKDAFTAKENFICNGAFVSATEFPNKFTDSSGERTQYKVILVKNPHWRGAAGVTTDRIEVLVNEKADEVLRRYVLHEVAWVSDGGLPPGEMRKVRAAKAATTPTKTALERDTKAASADLYDSASGSVMLLRFRCAAPLDKPEVRRALASLVDREAIAKLVGGGQPLVPTKRLVHPRTTGVLSSVAVPTWDPSKAKALYGPQKFTDTSAESWLKILALDTDSDVADALSNKAWPKGAISDSVAVTVQQADVFQREVDAGSWHVCVTRWRPDFDDPLAFLSGFTTGNQKGGLRWSNAAYDALIKGALDVAAFAAAPADPVKDRPAVKTALSKGTDPKALEELRRALLAEAEAILLDEAVVVPLWIPVETGILSPKARGVTVRGDRPRPLLDVLSFVGVGCE